MRWILLVPVALALAAAAVSTRVGQGPPHNVMLWLPAVVSAVPLLAPGNVLACTVVTVWLLLFAVVGGFTVGMFYLPSGVAMCIAALLIAQRRPASLSATETTGLARLSFRIAFGLTVLTSLLWLLVMLHGGGFRRLAYAYLLLPVLCASPPLWWRNPESTGGAAALLAGCAFFPLTASIGMWYAPAFAIMAYAAAKSGRLRP